MKKLTKLSLVAAVAVASLTSVATAGEMKVTSGVKAQYFDRKNDNADSNTIAVAGGYLKAEKEIATGLTAAAKVQFSSILNDTDAGTAFNSDLLADEGQVSELYLAYEKGDSAIKVGRQHIGTPLVANSGSRVVKDSFEAVLVSNASIKNTTIAAGYISEYQARTNGAGEIGTFEPYNDGAYTVLAKTQVNPNLAVTAQYAKVNAATDTNILFGEAAFKVNGVNLAAEVLNSDTATANGTLFGLKASTAVNGVSVTAAYTTTGDESVARGVGAGAFPAYAKLGVGAGAKSYSANTNSAMIKASTKVSGVTVGAGYATYDVDGTNNTETEVSAKYKLSSNATLVASHNMFGEADTRDSETRITLAYKF